MSPRYGFNFQWMFVWNEGKIPPPPDLDALDLMAEVGLGFVRIPTDYRFWTRDFDYLHPDEKVFEHIDGYIAACRARGLHACLNFHRAPGYCINRNELERDNLWADAVAQDGFAYQWELLARRYLGISNDDLSFDMVNEPPGIGRYGMTREAHAAVIRRTVAAIRAVDPEREIVIDGLGGGNIAMPELADLGVIQSCRGYQPMAISHHQAGWWRGSEDAPEPVYPGLSWNGKVWNRETLKAFYDPWRDVEAMGVRVHVGEFGCYDKTPNDIALRWFEDVLGIFKEFGWGYVLWGFRGSFGIVEHGRPGTIYEDWRGMKVDRKLLDLYLENRVV